MKKREYPQEMLLMGGCPNCGQEVNRQFVEKTIDDIANLAVSKEREQTSIKLEELEYLIKDIQSYESDGEIGTLCKQGLFIINNIKTK